MPVRFAQKGDELAILEAIELGHSDNGLWPLSQTKVLDLIDKATSINRTHESPIIGIIDGKNGIEAMNCLKLATQWYTDSWHLCELFNWVHPDHRQSKHAESLINFHRELTDKMSKTLGQKIALLTGVVTVKRLDAKINLFGKKYRQVGAIFAHNLDLAPDSYNQRRAME